MNDNPEDERLTPGSDGLRALFPALLDASYFDHAALAPLPSPAAAEMELMASRQRDQPAGLFKEGTRAVAAARRGAAALLDVRSEDIALVPNTTSALLIIANTIRWRPGDEVLVWNGEFPANLHPWRRLSEQGEVGCVVVSGAVAHDALLNGLTPRTRLLSVSTVQALDGQLVDVEALAAACAANGTMLCLDATQSLGVIPAELPAGVTFVAASGHKSMLGPPGTGILYVDPSRMAELAPGMTGWTSVADRFGAVDQELLPTASRYESGTMSFGAAAGLAASFELLAQVGVEAIARHVAALRLRIEQGLNNLGCEVVWPGHGSPILAFTPPGAGTDAVAGALSRAGVAVSCRGGRIRLATHCYNGDADVERLTAALDAFLSTR